MKQSSDAAFRRSAGVPPADVLQPERLKPFDRRESPRHPVQLTVAFPGGSGLTTDVSVSGIRFVSSSSFDPGQAIRFALTVAEPEDLPIRVQCDARVVRVDVHGNQSFISAAFNTLVFTTALTEEQTS